MIGRRMPYYVKRGIGGIDAHTVLMLHGEDLTDVSSLAHTITNNNSVTVNSAGHFGNCLEFTKNNNKYLSIPNNGEFTLGTEDFTIDFWIKTKSLADNDGIMSPRGNGSWSVNGGWLIAGHGSSSVMFNTYSYGTRDIPVPSGVWTHVAIVRSSGIAKTFSNGILQEIFTLGELTADSKFLIGKHDGNNYICLNAYLDEIRVSKGIARWTANFTPPTEPYSK